jgi:hypothetical protein
MWQRRTCGIEAQSGVKLGKAILRPAQLRQQGAKRLAHAGMTPRGGRRPLEGRKGGGKISNGLRNETKSEQGVGVLRCGAERRFKDASRRVNITLRAQRMPEADGGAQLIGTGRQRASPQIDRLIRAFKLQRDRRGDVEVIGIAAHCGHQGCKESVSLLRLARLQEPYRRSQTLSRCRRR